MKASTLLLVTVISVLCVFRGYSAQETTQAPATSASPAAASSAAPAASSAAPAASSTTPSVSTAAPVVGEAASSAKLETVAEPAPLATNTLGSEAKNEGGEKEHSKGPIEGIKDLIPHVEKTEDGFKVKIGEKEFSFSTGHKVRTDVFN